MKKLRVFLIGILACGNVCAQNVGIGTTTPAARLHVKDSSVLFSGGLWFLPNTPGDPSVEGSGTRMMWYADKAAFRVGAVSSTAWDKDSIGNYSFAAGLDVKAMATQSVSLGLNNRSAGWYSFTSGASNTALGVSSIAMGNNSVARNNGAVAMGYNLIARSVYGTVIGNDNDTSDAPRSIGSSSSDDRIFQIGNGSGITRSNALTVLRNGRVGIGAVVPQAPLHVSGGPVLFSATGTAAATPTDPPATGAGRRMMWYTDRAAFRVGYVGGNQWDKDNVGDYTFAAGYETKASSIGAFASGINSTAGNFTTVAMGYQVTASGAYATAFGYTSTASGYYSLALGNVVVASGSSSVAFGEGTNIKSVGGFVSGRYNNTSDNPDAFTPQASDRIFQIGNGSDNNNRNNALTVLRNGNVGIGNLSPAKPLSFPATLGEKILLYPGGTGEVGIGVYGNELRLHCDNPGSKVSFGTQDNAGNYTELAKAQSSGAFAFSIYGSLWVNGTTYASDERFKQNISGIANPLEKLMQIRGVEYEMNTAAFPKNHFTAGRQIGLLAQDVEKVIPEAVNEKDGYKGVDYARLVPLLIESIKAQQAQINGLKQELQDLRQQKAKQ